MFLAPEIINGDDQITTKADIWSLGAILYLLVTGNIQMGTDQSPDTVNFDFNESQWRNYGSIIRDFIQYCLQVDPQRRPTAVELIQESNFMQLYNQN